jgi:hypothetical protein
MVNEQFTWLTPFSQQAQPELTWRNQSREGAKNPTAHEPSRTYQDPKAVERLRASSNRGREKRLSSFPPPSEPDVRVSRIRLSSQEVTFEKDWR